MPASRVVGILTALAIVVISWRARADSEPIRIHFTAHAGCPDQAAFTREVQARTARARIAGVDEPARVFTVTVTPKGHSSQGELKIRDLDGATSVREVSGRACAEVVSALALIAALAIDPKASTAPEPPPIPPPVEPPTTPTSPPALPYFPPGAAPHGQPLFRYEDPRRPVLWPPIAEPLPVWIAPPWMQPPQPRWRVSAGGHLIAVGGIAPSLGSGILVFFDAARDEPDVVSPALRLSLMRATSGGIETTAGVASFRWTAGRVEACPVRFGLDQLSARPCAAFDLGALEGYGTQSAIRPWVAFGLIARLQWVILDLVQLEAQGGLILPLIQDDFVFKATGTASDVAVHQTPAAGGIVGVGVGIRFP